MIKGRIKSSKSMTTVPERGEYYAVLYDLERAIGSNRDMLPQLGRGCSLREDLVLI